MANGLVLWQEYGGFRDVGGFVKDQADGVEVQGRSG